MGTVVTPDGYIADLDDEVGPHLRVMLSNVII